MGYDRTTCPHRFDQGWVGTTDAMAMQVKTAVVAQGLNHRSFINGTRKNNLCTGRIHHLTVKDITVRSEIS
ncbi:hypothetical protein D3C75_1218820 [compost metagenome]